MNDIEQLKAQWVAMTIAIECLLIESPAARQLLAQQVQRWQDHSLASPLPDAALAAVAETLRRLAGTDQS